MFTSEFVELGYKESDPLLLRLRDDSRIVGYLLEEVTLDSRVVAINSILQPDTKIQMPYKKNIRKFLFSQITNAACLTRTKKELIFEQALKSIGKLVDVVTTEIFHKRVAAYKFTDTEGEFRKIGYIKESVKKTGESRLIIANMPDDQASNDKVKSYIRRGNFKTAYELRPNKKI